MQLPNSLQEVIEHFSQLPGLGKKSAERMAFHLLNADKQELTNFAASLQHLRDDIKLCRQCFNFSENDPCDICRDPRRENSLLAIVARQQDIAALENTSEYRGLYFVLGGTLNTLEGRGPDSLRLNELKNRLTNKQIKEIVLAFNPDLDGETTMVFLAKFLSTYPAKVTRLARGLPLGSDIEYADQTTLADALKGRRTL